MLVCKLWECVCFCVVVTVIIRDALCVARVLKCIEQVENPTVLSVAFICSVKNMDIETN